MMLLPEKDFTVFKASEQGGLDRDQAIINQLETWFLESKTSIDTQRERWRKNEKLYYNQGGDFKVPKGATKLKFALPMAIIETEMPIVKDFMPSFDVMALDDNDQWFADKMQARKSEALREADFEDAFLNGVHNSKVFSNGLIYLAPDFDSAGKYIGLKADGVDIFTWFPSPDAVGMDIRTEAEYHIFITPKTVNQILIKYKINVPAEGWIDDFKCFRFVEGAEQPNYQRMNCALIKECYRMDPDVAKYPNGRETVWVRERILYDGPMRGRIPYFMIPNYKTSHSIFAMAETELVRTQVKCLNQVMSALADTINKTGNPIRKVLRSWWAGKVKAIAGVAGEEVVVDKQSDIMWEGPPTVPKYIFEFVNLLMKLTDVVTGIHDVTEGRKPAGIESGRAILALQEAAQARIRYQISKTYSKIIKDMGRYVIDILQEFDAEAKKIRVQAESGGYTYIDYDPVGLYQVKDGGAEKVKEGGRSIKNTKFDIEIVAGVSQPAGRVASEERALDYFEKGIYGVEDVMKHSSDPDKQEIINRFYKRLGVKALSDRFDERNKAYTEFKKLTEKARKAAEGEGGEVEWVGSIDEKRAAGMLLMFPDFLETDEFNYLPMKFKKRLMVVFQHDPEPLEEAAA